MMIRFLHSVSLPSGESYQRGDEVDASSVPSHYLPSLLAGVSACEMSEARLESLSKVCEDTHRISLEIPCSHCSAGIREPHKEGCCLIASGKDRHKVRPDLYAADGQEIFPVKKELTVEENTKEEIEP